jgi:hypothetical protein
MVKAVLKKKIVPSSPSSCGNEILKTVAGIAAI